MQGWIVACFTEQIGSLQQFKPQDQLRRRGTAYPAPARILRQLGLDSARVSSPYSALLLLPVFKRGVIEPLVLDVLILCRNAKNLQRLSRGTFKPVLKA